MQPSLESSQLNDRVRKKRSHREKRLKQKTASSSPQPHTQHQESQLEDSTAGVASILQQQLRATEQDEAKKQNKRAEVIVNEGAELSPRFESGGGGGHSSGVVTECEDEANQSPAVRTAHQPETAGR